MALNYQSGEEIRKDDRVTFHGEAGEIELVADPLSNSLSAEERWFVEEDGGGVLVREPKVFGRVFIPAAQLADTEDLIFVSRAPEADLGARKD